MKAIQFRKFGGPEVLQCVELETPIPDKKEVLIQVKAIGVNYADTARREGRYVVETPLPFVPGLEVAGVVTAIGEEVRHSKLGDRVVTMIGGNGYADYVVTREHSIIPIPNGVSDQLAVALPVQGLSAYHIIKTMGRLKKGETILVHAGAGGVGTLAIQLAKLFGAGKIIATASTEEKLALAKSLGADILVNYSVEGWEEKILVATDGQGVDVALEMAGGDVFHKTLRCLAPFGRLVIYGVASGELSRVVPSSLMEKNLSIIGFFLPQILRKRDLLQQSMEELLTLVSTGKLTLTIGGEYPLIEAKKVHELLQGRKTKGKLILIP